VSSELEKINQTVTNTPYMRNKEGKLVKNPNYVPSTSKQEEVKKQEIEKKQVPIAQEEKKPDIKPSAPPQPTTFQKAVDHNGTDPITQEYKNKLSEDATISAKGINGDKISEPIPEYISSPCEKVISGENNTFIVLGRDRSGTRISGYGGKGDTKCGSIDIVVGRLGFESRKVDENNEQLWVDPNFEKDAARIYISQKADVDEYFGIVAGKVGNSKTKSAIALKADGVRIIGREGIKIVTGVDKFNSQGGDIKVISGIDLIANNDESALQPLVKGENLALALKRLTNHVDKLNGIVDAFLMSQMEYNRQIASHFHISPYFAAPTSPSQVLVPAGIRCAMNQAIKVKKSLVIHKKNLAGFRLTYLEVFGKKYINSRYNNTN
jgi:hypothetical protein